MTLLKHRLNIVPLALAIALTGLLHPAAAETLKIPKDGPVFVFDTPEGWTHEVDKDGDIKCTPADDKKGFYVLQVISLPDIHTKAELKKELPGVAKSIAKGKLTELALGDIEDSKNGNGVPFTGLRADGKSDDGTPIVIVLHGFEPQKGKWYIIMTIGTEKAYDFHSDEYDTISASIQTLK